MNLRPTKALVAGQCALYNQAFFGGVLRPTIQWARMRNLGDCFEPSGRHPYGLIRLSTMMPRDVRWEEVLLHELVHNYLDLLYPDTDEYDHGVVQYHGPVFRDECNRIGAVLGLPEVDEEHCWYWPMCVRLAEHPEPARYE